MKILPIGVIILLTCICRDALANDFDRLTEPWRSNAANKSVYLRARALGHALKQHIRYIDSLTPPAPPGSRSTKYLEDVRSATLEAFLLTYQDAIPLLKSNPDHTMSWWLMFYFGDRVASPSDIWCQTIRRLCLSAPETTSRIRFELEDEDYLHLRDSALKTISNTSAELQEIQLTRRLFDSLSEDQYRKKYPSPKTRD